MSHRHGKEEKAWCGEGGREGAPWLGRRLWSGQLGTAWGLLGLRYWTKTEQSCNLYFIFELHPLKAALPLWF